MLDQLKLLANKRDVPYQSLLKMIVAERLKTGVRGLIQRTSKNRMVENLQRLGAFTGRRILRWTLRGRCHNRKRMRSGEQIEIKVRPAS